MRFLKVTAIILNVLLITMFASYFMGHGLPNNIILWASATLWLVAPIVNIVFIARSSS